MGLAPEAEEAAHARVMDHSRRPRNQGLLQPSDTRGRATNPICGDWVELTLRLDERGRIEAAGFEGVGCSVSQATASILFDGLRGRSLQEAAATSDDELLAMLGLQLNHNRQKCALVALQALRSAGAR